MNVWFFKIERCRRSSLAKQSKADGDYVYLAAWFEVEKRLVDKPTQKIGVCGQTCPEMSADGAHAYLAAWFYHRKKRKAWADKPAIWGDRGAAAPWGRITRAILLRITLAILVQIMTAVLLRISLAILQCPVRRLHIWMTGRARRA